MLSIRGRGTGVHRSGGDHIQHREHGDRLGVVHGYAHRERYVRPDERTSEEAREKQQTNTVELSTGVTLQYAEQGDPAGTPVLLLHGLSDSWYSFRPLLPYLPRSIRALALTQRGHGDSSRPENRYRYTDFVADAAAFLDALNVEAAVVVGHSMGSAIAQRFAIDHPERTLGLCLVAAFHSLATNETPRQLWEVVAQMEDPVEQDFVQEFQKSTIVGPVPQGFIDDVVRESMKLPARVWKDVVACSMQDDFSSELHKITAPTLLVWGDQDAMVPRSDQEAQLAAITGAQLEVYEGTGHALHWEEPEHFGSDLVRFIEDKAK